MRGKKKEVRENDGRGPSLLFHVARWDRGDDCLCPRAGVVGRQRSWGRLCWLSAWLERARLGPGWQLGWAGAWLAAASRSSGNGSEWPLLRAPERCKVGKQGPRAEQGWTALHYAAQNGSKDAVDELLRAGAYVDDRDVSGRRRVAVACQCAQYSSLFTQPAPLGRPSRFSSHRKGAGLPHPISGGGSGL